MLTDRYGNELKTVKITDIFKTHTKQMKNALYLPGRTDGSSLCTQFMYNWFLNKFGGESAHFFHSINLDGSDPASYLKKWTLKDWIKRPRPKLSVIPKSDISYDRDFTNDDYNDIMMYINRTRGKDVFFDDVRNNVRMGIASRLNMMNFTFKINVEQRPQQLDLYDHIYMSCRVGKSITLYSGLDFLVPDKLIKRLVQDLKFEANEDGMPANYTKFLDYMNTYSKLPFLYKARGVTHKFEFFVRIEDIMFNIRDIELDIDDGETEGMLQANYGLEMRCNVRFPSPKYFVLFSYNDFDTMVYRDNIDNKIMATDLVVTPIPRYNVNNWPIYLDGIFENDHENECLNVSLYDMFKSGTPTNDILDTIRYCKTRHLSPEIFIDVKVFNNLKEQESFVDWERMVLITRTPVKLKKSTIVVYTDNKFMFNAIAELRGHYKDRMNYKRDP